MAQAFNLTAQLNLRGPNNIRQIVSDIRKQVGTITGNIKFNIDPTAINNTGKLNKSLQELNTNLSNVASTASAASAAIKNFGQSVSSIGNSSAKLSSNLNKTAQGADKLGVATTKSAKNIAIAHTEMEEFGRQSALAVRRFAAFSAVTGVFFSLNRAVNSGIKSFIDFDKELVKLQQITGKNAEGLRGLQDEIVRLSTGLGVSSDSLIQVSSTLAQAGLSATETRASLEALARSSLAPSFDDINQTVEGSIALMRQFGISAKELEKALGSVNAVAAAFAVEASDIIAAIQRTGGVFASASKGVSEGTDALNEFIAVFTSVRATTRESAETIATGLRTIFTRIQRAGTIEALKEFGVNLTDVEGKFVGAYKAVQLLSEGLGRIDPRDIRFSQIVEELGGFRQIGKVIPLIQQFATAQDALKIAQAGQGSLAADAAKAQLSLANQISKVKEEFLALIREVGGGDTFQTLSRGALGLASGLIKITGALKGVLPALAILGAGAGLRGITQFTGGFIGGLKKVQGKPGSGSESVSSIGRNVASTLVGAKTEQVSRDLDQNSAALDKVSSNLDTLTSSINNLNGNINAINALLNNNNVLLQQSISSLANNTSSLDRLTDAINNFKPGGGSTLSKGGPVLGFSSGGTVPGTGRGDKIPAMLEPGEVVMSNRAVNRYGRGNLVRMNKYAKGGPTSLEELSSIKGGRSIKSYFDKTIQAPDEVFADIRRINISKEDIANFYKTNKDPSTRFRKDINKVSSLYLSRVSSMKGAAGLAFEDFIVGYLQKQGINYSKTSNVFEDDTFPLDLIGEGLPPAEVRFRSLKTDDNTILAKKLRYDLISSTKPSFTPKIDKDDKAINLGQVRLYEIDPDYKTSLGLKTGGIVPRKAGGKTSTRPQREIFDSSPTPMLQAIIARTEGKKPGARQVQLRDYAEEITDTLNTSYDDNQIRGGVVSMLDQHSDVQRYIDVSIKALKADLAYINKGSKLSSDPRIKPLKTRKGISPGDMLDTIMAYQSIGLDYVMNTALAEGRTDQTLEEFMGDSVTEPYKGTPRGKLKISQLVKNMEASAQYEMPSVLYSGLGDSKLDIILKQAKITQKNTIDDLVGKTFSMPSFLSASSAEGIAGEFARAGSLTILTNPKRKGIVPQNAKSLTLDETKLSDRSQRLIGQGEKGFAGLPVDRGYAMAYDQEGEYIFPPNSKFRITDIDRFNSRLFPGEGDNNYRNVEMKVQQLKDGGVAERKVGYIDYDVIANPANEDIVKKGMESAGVTGPRLYTDHLTELAIKARKDSSLQKIRAIYGVAGSGKTTLARGQGTDKGKLRETTRFPILTPEDIQKANEILVLSSSVGKDKLDTLFKDVDRAYTLSSTTSVEKERIKAQRENRDITGIGLEGRTPGVTSGVGKDTAIGEALLQDRLGDKSVVLGRSASGKLRRKRGDELVEIIKKKIGYTWGGFAPMTAGHESIMDAAAAQGIPPEDFLFLVGANEGIELGDSSSYRTAIFNQDARVLLAKAGAGKRGATVLPKASDFEVPSGFDISGETGRRKVLLPAKGSTVFVADKTPQQTAKYKDAGYKVASIERSGGISGTMVRDLIEKGDLAGLQKVLSPEVYELISNNIGRIQNRARVLPDIVSQVQKNQEVKLADVEKAINAVGITRIDKKKLDDPEYAAKAQVLEDLRKQRNKIKSAASFEPYKLLDQLAISQPDKYALDFSSTSRSDIKPVRTIGSKRPQQANIGGLIQKFMAGGTAEKPEPEMMTDEIAATKGRSEILDFLRDKGEGLIETAKAVGSSVPEIRRAMGVRSPDAATKTLQDAVRREYVKTYNRRIGAAKRRGTIAKNRGLEFAAAGILGSAFSPKDLLIQADEENNLSRSVMVRVMSGLLDPSKAAQVDQFLTTGVDDLSTQVARGISGTPPTGTAISNPSATGAIQGHILEQAIQKLGGPGKTPGMGMDFPHGLQGAAQHFGLPPDVPTDLKRTLYGPSTITDNIVTYLKNVKGYAAGGQIQKFAKAGKVEFGSGTTAFPKRISNSYFKAMQKMEDSKKLERAFETYPKDERINIDDEAVKTASSAVFNKELFIQSFKDRISRDSLFHRMGQFAKFIGLPSDDLAAFLPSQIDFKRLGTSFSTSASFTAHPSTLGTRGLDGVDLSEFGFSEADKQDMYGYSKLIEEKKKEVEKVLKTPVKTFDDGSFSYDRTKAQTLWDEIDALKQKHGEKLKLNSQAIARAQESRKAIADASGRGSINIFQDPFNSFGRKKYNTLYHEMVHQLFNSLRTKQADTFTKYKERVTSLFTGDNDDLADAFDSLDGGYKSADVVYGRSYKQSGLDQLLLDASRSSTSKSTTDKESLSTLRSITTSARSYTKAKDFKSINPDVNQLLLKNGYDQNVINKMEDNGKEEFLTTLVQNLPQLDSNLQGILDSTLNDLLSSGGIKRQQYAVGGKVNLYHGSNTGTNDSVLESFKQQGARADIAHGYGQGAGFYAWSDKDSAKRQAKTRVNNLGSFVTVSGDTSGKPMVVTISEMLDPKTWDLDYELNKGTIVKWLHENYKDIKDVLAPTAGITGIKDIINPGLDPVSGEYIMSPGISVETAKGGRKPLYSGTVADTTEGQIIGELMSRLQSTNADLVYKFENEFFKSPSLAAGKWPGLALKYVGSEPLKPTNIETFAYGGAISRFASGGSVPALVSNGEAYVPPKMAKKIGYGNLNRINQADKNGMGRFADGGISIFKGPGNGTSDSIRTNLPVGSFIIREKATKALGLNKGGGVGIQKFAFGGTSQDRDLVETRARIRGVSFDAEVAMMRKALIDSAKDLMNPTERQNTLRIMALENNSRLVLIKKREEAERQSIDDEEKAAVASAGGDVDKIKAARDTATQKRKDSQDRVSTVANSMQDALIEKIKEINPSLAEDELATVSKKIADGLEAGESIPQLIKRFSDLGDNTLKDIFTGSISSAKAQEIAAQKLAEQFGLTEEAAKSLASAADINLSDTFDKNSAAAARMSAMMAKASLVIGTFSSGAANAIRSFGGSENRGAIVTAAGVEGFGSTTSTIIAALSQVKPAVEAVIGVMGQMGGSLGSLATTIGPQLMGLLANPITAAVAGVVVATVGLAAAFKESWNAAREFDKQLANKRVEQSLERIGVMFDDFSKDMTKINILSDINKELNQAIGNAFTSINIDTQVPKMFWANMIDAATAGASDNNRIDSAQRSMILEKKGFGAYLESSSVFGSGRKGQEKYMFELAPQLASQQAQTFKPMADNIFKLFDSKLRTGSSIDELMGELRDATGAPTQFANAIARSNPIIEEQIIKTQARADITDKEKQEIINGIVAREAEKQAILNTRASLRQIEFEKLDKAVGKFITSLERVYSNMEMSINRAAFEVQKLSDSAELASSSLSGNAKAGETRLSSINVLQNRRAYGTQDQNNAVDMASSFFGSLAPGISSILNIGDKLETSILSTINRTRKAEPGATDERVFAKIESNLNSVLSDLQIPENLVPKFSGQIKDALKDIKTKGDLDTVNFEQIAEAVPGLTKQIESARRAQEVAVKALEFYQSQLNEYANAMNSMVELQFEANKDFARAADIIKNGNNELSKAFGREISLRDQVNTFLGRTSRQTGGATDPTDISRNILNLENSRKILQGSANAAADKGPSGKDEFVLMQDRLRNTNLALRQNYDALKNLAESSDIASAAMEKIQEIQRRREAGANLIEKTVTSSPEELVKLNSAIGRLQNNMMGMVNNGTTSEQRGESLQAFNQIAPLLGDGAKQNELKANVLESMLIESGQGINPMFAQVLDTLRNPEADPEMQAAINTYKQGLQIQSEANSKLGEIKLLMSDNTADIAAEKLKTAITGAKLSFESQTLTEINKNIIELKDFVKNKKPGAAGLARGGVVYASAGQAIDFAPKGTDTVPAMLTPGEFVVNRKATRNNLPLLQNINSGKYSNGGRVNYLADGGIVPGKDWTTADKRDGFKKSEREKTKTLSTKFYFDVIKEPVPGDQKTLFSVPATSFKGARIASDVFSSATRNWFTQRSQSIPIDLGRPVMGFSYGEQEYNKSGSKSVRDYDIGYPHAGDFFSESFSSLTSLEPFLDKKSSKLTRDEVDTIIPKYEKIINLIDKDFITLDPKKFIDTPINIPQSTLSLTMPSFVRGGGPETYASAQIKLDNLSAMDKSKRYLLSSGDSSLNSLMVADNTSASIFPRGSWTGTSPVDLTTANNAGVSEDAISANMPNIAKSLFNNRTRIYESNLEKPDSNLQDLYETLKDIVENGKKDKFDISSEFQNKKTTISLLEDFVDRKLFSIQLGESGKKIEEQILLDGPNSTGKSLPLTLYNIGADTWTKQIEKFQPLLEQSKNRGIKLSQFLPITDTFQADSKNFIDLMEIDTGKELGRFPWLSQDFSSLSIEPELFTSMGSVAFGPAEQTLFGKVDPPEIYGKENSLEPLFTYSKITAGTRYDPFRRQFIGAPINYYVVDKETVKDPKIGPQSPFSEMDADKLFVPEDSWKNFTQILSKGTDLKVADGFKYNFTSPMGGFSELKSVGNQYDTILKDFLPYIVPDTVFDQNINAVKFKETISKRSSKIESDKGIDAAKKGAKITLEKDEALTNAKKVGIARAVYDIGKNVVGITSAKPTSIGDVGSIIRELGQKAAPLASGGGGPVPEQRLNNPSWLITDAYRAFFSELYKGTYNGNDQDTPQFLKGLGITLKDNAFTDPKNAPQVSVAGMKGKTEAAYIDYINPGIVEKAIRNIINREMMMKSMGTFAGSLSDADKQKAAIKAGTSRIQDSDGKQDIIPESYNDIAKIGLDPRNVFPDKDFRTQNYLNVLEELYDKGTNTSGDAIFNPGDPRYLTASQSIDTLKTWYGTNQDKIVNTALTPEQMAQNQKLLIDGEVLEVATKRLYDKSQEANAFLTGNQFGPLPDAKQLSAMLDLEMSEPINPINKATGGLIYASAGQLVNFQPKGTDTVPAMLTPGEFVINRKATQDNLPLLHAINNGYSAGGMVYLAGGGKPDDHHGSEHGGHGPAYASTTAGNITVPVLAALAAREHTGSLSPRQGLKGGAGRLIGSGIDTLLDSGHTATLIGEGIDMTREVAEKTSHATHALKHTGTALNSLSGAKTLAGATGVGALAAYGGYTATSLVSESAGVVSDILSGENPIEKYQQENDRQRNQNYATNVGENLTNPGRAIFQTGVEGAGLVSDVTDNIIRGQKLDTQLQEINKNRKNTASVSFAKGGIVYLARGGVSPGNDPSRFGPDGRLLSVDERAEMKMREAREREAAAVAQVNQESDARIQASIDRSRAANKQRIQDNKAREEAEKPRKEELRTKAKAVGLNDTRFEYIYRQNQRYGTNPIGTGFESRYDTAIDKIPLSRTEQQSMFDNQLAKVKAESAAFSQKRDELTRKSGTEITDRYKRKQAGIDKKYGFRSTDKDSTLEKTIRRMERDSSVLTMKDRVELKTLHKAYSIRRKIERQLKEDFVGSSPEVFSMIDDSLSIITKPPYTAVKNGTSIEDFRILVQEELTRRMRQKRVDPTAAFRARMREVRPISSLSGADNLGEPGQDPYKDRGTGPAALMNIFSEEFSPAALSDIYNNVFKPAQAARERRNFRRYGVRNPNNIQRKSKGGIIYANNGMLVPYAPRGTDTIPAMLTPGEFVINRQATQQYRPVLEAINNGNYNRGGIVNYLQNGGYLPIYKSEAGNVNSMGKQFDLTSYMGDIVSKIGSGITEAIDKAIQNTKPPTANNAGVSNNTDGISSIDSFVNRLNNIANILSNIYIPPQITITGKHDVVVTINGDTVLNQLQPDIQAIVMTAIRGAFQNLKANNPENNTIDFNIDFANKMGSTV